VVPGGMGMSRSVTPISQPLRATGWSEGCTRSRPLADA